MYSIFKSWIYQTICTQRYIFEYIVYILHVDHMLIAVKKMTKICILKTQINRKFEIKYLGLIKKILDIKIVRVDKNSS